MKSPCFRTKRCRIFCGIVCKSSHESSWLLFAAFRRRFPQSGQPAWFQTWMQFFSEYILISISAKPICSNFTDLKFCGTFIASWYLSNPLFPYNHVHCAFSAPRLGIVLFLDWIQIRSRQEAPNGRFEKNQYCNVRCLQSKSLAWHFLEWTIVGELWFLLSES